MARITLLVAVMSLVLSPHILPGAHSTTFTLVNKCGHTVWPGILSNAGTPPFPTTGFSLTSGSSKSLTAPSAWGGRFWARTYCTTSSSSNSFSCLTGDCSSGSVDCSGKTASPPATLAEFTLDGSGGLDFYDVSLVDGYNLPVLVTPQGGSGQNCTTTGCIVDLNGSCPSDLRVTSSESDGGVVACKSACEAYRRPEYCCSGEYNSPATCKPSSYSEVFKSACPKAYSYAYDDRTSTFTCTSGADYVITFCPSPNTSQKSASSSDQQTPASSNDNSPLFNNSTMIYTGVQGISDPSPSVRGTSPGLISVTAAAAASMLLLLWRLT